MVVSLDSENRLYHGQSFQDFRRRWIYGRKAWRRRRTGGLTCIDSRLEDTWSVTFATPPAWPGFCGFTFHLELIRSHAACRNIIVALTFCLRHSTKYNQPSHLRTYRACGNAPHAFVGRGPTMSATAKVRSAWLFASSDCILMVILRFRMRSWCRARGGSRPR